MFLNASSVEWNKFLDTFYILVYYPTLHPQQWRRTCMSGFMRFIPRAPAAIQNLQCEVRVGLHGRECMLMMPEW